MAPTHQLLLFGSQALSFDGAAFATLQKQLHEPAYQWALDVISSLPEWWSALETNIPTLQHLEQGKQLLEELKSGVHTGEIAPSRFPLPNILLSPLVVLGHLIEYTALVRALKPNLSDTEPLSLSVTTETEILGLCTGVLSAFAVGSSSTLADLTRHGATAIRLSVLVGALVDAEQSIPDGHGPSTSFSITGNIDKVLENVPDAYVSVFLDERRSTVTTSKTAASTLVQQAPSAGAHAVELALSGRFHWPGHENDTAQALQFCEQHPEFQFPDASQLVFASRSETAGRYLSTGKLHEAALREILTRPTNWIKTFGNIYASHLSTADARVLAFGSERCVPPTIARKLGTRLIYVSDLDLSTSPLPAVLGDVNADSRLSELPDDRIAVIGMSCHVPGGADLAEYWEMLCSGLSQHIEVPSERFSMETPWRKLEANRKWYGNFMKDYDTIDHRFFKKSAREMASTDPQQRVMLQLAYQAVEQSGYFAGSTQPDQHIGCFVGIGNVEYETNIRCHPANAYSATGNLRAFNAGKISHYFGWTGPSVTVDTACSSSSVAIHQACRAILHGECSSALAGGVNVLTNPDWFYNLAGASFLSPTGQCKPFDAKGDGYCRGEGAGAVMLKRLSDAIRDGDQVFGVIAASRVYQNQNCTAITVPNSPSLSELFVDVVRQARLEPKNVSVVEAHGTGTPVGDPAEYDAIRTVLGQSSKRSDALHLSSVKGSIGHTEFASGVVSLLKVLLMIHEGVIPPQASFTVPNPALNARAEDRVEIPTRVKQWQSDFRTALINNYGASGSNASMVVTQSHQPLPTTTAAASKGQSYPFWLSALDEHRLRAYVSKLRAFLRNSSNSTKDLSVANLSFQVSRQANRSLPQALQFSATSLEDLDGQLAAFERNEKVGGGSQPVPATRPVILCFGGQISTWVGLDEAIYQSFPLLRTHLDQCDAVAVALGLDSIYPDLFQRTPVADPIKLQTLLFALQYSTARTWIDCGLQVAAAVGHSFGELVALCVCGVYSIKDALQLVAGRARLIRDHWGSDRGSMLAVEADKAQVDKLIEQANEKNAADEAPISIACFNGPTTFTLAGGVAAVDRAEALVKSESTFIGLKAKRLNVSNAFHSALVDPLVEELHQLGQTVAFNEPVIPIEQATASSAARSLDGSYLAQHMRQPVFFNHAVRRLAQQHPTAIWLEAGSNSTVTNLASRALEHPRDSHFQPVNVTSDNSHRFLVDATLGLWKAGVNVAFWAHHSSLVSDYHPLLLPPYQFEKVQHWMELAAPPTTEVVVEKVLSAPEAPKGLLIWLGYQDREQTQGRFELNTKFDRLHQVVSANVVLNTVPLMPGMFQGEVALHALEQLRPDLRGLGFQPELRDMLYQAPVKVDPAAPLYVDLVSTDSSGLEWQWKLHGASASGSLTYTSGKILLRAANDPQGKNDYESLSRLSGRQRGIRLLSNPDAEEVLQGRNIYRAFENVVHYQEPFRRLSKIVADSHESAGRLKKAWEAEGWIDSVLTECFCQVAGIYANLMTDAGPGDVFVCDRIDRWTRNPRLKGAEGPIVWEVFAVHQQQSTNSITSDVFAFDTRDGSLAEAILGVSFQRVSLDGLRKVLGHATPFPSVGSQASPSTLTESIPVPVSAPAPAAPTVTVPVPSAPLSAPSIPNGTNNVAPKSKGPDVTAKTREIVCNLSGLEPEEIQDDADLAMLGIDSLMAMELVREVEAAFHVTLQNDQLMELTDFNSLAACIRSTLGETEEPSVNGHSNGVNGSNQDYVSNGTNGINGSNGVHDINGVNGTNGHHQTNGFHKTSLLDAAIVHEVFGQVKWETDDFIVKGQLDTYHDKVVPRSTELCIVYIVNAFEELGCPIRTAAAGQELQRITYLPRHERFINLIYDLLETDARLIDRKGSAIIRTAVAAPTKTPEALAESLIRDEPVHAAEHKLTAMIGPKFADCLTGKADALQLMFGAPEGREIVTDMYANSPITGIWIQQLAHFVEQLVRRLPANGEPLRILELGAGTGGTTSKIVPLLHRLGIPVHYTMTDLSGSLVATARKRFKQYPFMDFKVVDIESAPDAKLLQSQHIVFATNCVHATRNLSISLTNIHQLLRPDGFLMLLEMTEMIPWVDFIFGLVEGWWLFEDDRDYVLQPATHWERKLQSVGFGHVDWTEGHRPEASFQRLIIAHASGPRYARIPAPPAAADAAAASPAPESSALTRLAERQAVIDSVVARYTADFPDAFPADADSIPAAPASSSHRCVLITGGTGSLGAHIMAALAQRPDIDRVVCLNRLSTTDAAVRQQQSLDLRGITLDAASQAKLTVLATDTSKPSLGLSPSSYLSLVHTVTDIVHSAWPMSLTRPVKAYESQFKVFRNLLDLAASIARHRPPPFQLGFQFISSLAVVGNYGLQTGHPLVPEDLTSIEFVPETGYADAKLACEHILNQTLHRHPSHFHATAVRIAQIAGSTSNGFWNPTEYIPFLIKTSQVLHLLPDLSGTLSWYPVDLVASTLADLLLSKSSPTQEDNQLIYHIDNPARQPWKEMISSLASTLDIPLDRIVPYEQWLDRMRRFRASPVDNPALQLLDLFTYYFIPMSCGGLVLDTEKTRVHSPTMQSMQPVSGDLVKLYVEAWKRSGFLNQ
ncbi:putative polyketide synthase [Aspergillus steynii IBT 23096]|uniref:Putative polyketide synthase n=1 Tax=Aspergillus steynii IBT 23096 TaxID=1392250 RepID=A0A2I2FUK3_9EURO|nr:putative polyketide synthase [Aspergillus steynii IBT 23096]PLB44277.1 putative polyketide synthase [Aspergillus steynii IBT 23096]